MALTTIPVDRHLQELGVADPDGPEARALVSLLESGATESADVRRIPAPLPPCGPFPEGRLSPRLLVLLARALATESGHNVLLAGDPLVALAAALDRLPALRRPAQITVLSRDASRAAWTAERLGIGPGSDRPVEIVALGADSSGGPHQAVLHARFERVLTYRLERRPERLAPILRPDAVVVSVTGPARRPRLVQHVRLDGEGADVDLSDHRFDTPWADSKRGRGLPVHRLLQLEPMLLNVWREQAPTPIEQSVRSAVRETFNEEVPGVETQRIHLARRLFHLGYLEQVAGTRAGAEALYRASLAVLETPEAWTFYGWVRSQRGSVDEAIEACQRAIELDADFGNPYNDIGAYLLLQGEPEEAKDWFRRATEAPRYAAPHYPYTNLGRLYLREGDLEAARDAVLHALERVPDYPPAQRLLREIEARQMRDTAP